MAVQPIRLLGDPILWQHCTPILDVQTPEAHQLATNLRDTLEDFRKRKGFGRGIAAPQIGVPLRVIYINMAFDKEQKEGTEPFCGVMVNPEILQFSSDTFELWDDCFSFPDLLVRVRRYSTIIVQYTSFHNSIVTLEATGSFSELLQHEIDHLDGILAINRAITPQSFALREFLQP